MNILRLTTRIYPDIGGPAVYAFRLSKNLSNEKFKMINIACKPENINKNAHIVNPNFIIHYLPLRVPPRDANLLNKIIFTIKLRDN